MNIFELSLPDNDEQYAPEDYMSEANIRQEKDKEKEQEETANLTRSINSCIQTLFNSIFGGF